MAGNSVEVHAYTLDRLKQLFVEAAKASKERVDKKSHVTYLDDYLKHIRVKTIVVERDYIDRDYFEDYSGYYVRCFHQGHNPYGPHCCRLHFFSREFSKDDLEAVLSKSTTALKEAELQAAYLGFHVIKPLPETFIGRTCLRPYEHDGRREFPIRREYDVNLFGLRLKIGSLAFQEQDSVVAACATSALWSAFHGTGELFQHSIPSPLEITKAATATAPMYNRAMPNRGLTIPMMTHAIRHVGLEPDAVDQEKDPNFHLLKSTAYAYLRAEIPVVMGIDLVDTSAMLRRQSIGFHAVTIAGYSLGLTAPVPFQKSGFLLRAARIDKLYVHDDQVGPFARMEIGSKALKTEWSHQGMQGKVEADPVILLIPLYHKIRIPFMAIHRIVNRFDQFFRALMNVAAKGKVELEWDIYLTTVSRYKSSLLDSGLSNTLELQRILLSPLPKFIWVATAYLGGVKQMDLLFDATNIEQGDVFVDDVQHSGLLRPLLSPVCKSQAVLSTAGTTLDGIQQIIAKFAVDR